MAYKGADRIRDRSELRAGTTRKYRSNINGNEVDAVGKIRWEMPIG